MIPLIDKDAVRIITQNITPEETEYVAGISNIISDLKNTEVDEDNCDDVIYVAKIMAFADKFRALHWAARSMSYHKALDDFYDEIEKYKDEIAENIQSIIGQFTGKEFTKLELPIDDNPLSIINELKICVTNWLNLHKDEEEYIGCESLTTAFLAVVHKYIYLFRLCKNNEI